MVMDGDAHLASSLLSECGRPSTVMASTETSLKIELVDDNEDERWVRTGRSASIAGVKDGDWRCVDGWDSMAHDQVLDEDKSEGQAVV
jgi:hypothetical protein